MTIELIDKTTVKVTLTKFDMEVFGVTYENMDYKQVHTKRLFNNIQNKIKQELNMNFFDKKLLIEAFPFEKNGCILYISSGESKNTINNFINNNIASFKNNKSTFNTPLIFDFENIENLISLCKILYGAYSHIILKSSLYYMHEKYKLLIYTYFKLDNKISMISEEFGTFCGKGPCPESLIQEHGNLIAEDNAIEIIVNYLS